MSARPVPVLLMVRALGIGGSERQMSVIARSLDRSRFEPHVACWHAEGLRLAELREAGIPVLRLPFQSFKSPAVIKAAFEFDRYIRRHGIRLVHSFDYPACLFAAPVLWLFRTPALSLSSQRSHRELVSKPVHRSLRITDKLVRAIVVNSAQVRRHLMEDEGVPPERIHICYNGIDLSAFRPPDSPAPRPEPLRSASLVVGVVCAFRPEKDLGTLVRAFAIASRASAGMRLLMVGDGPCKRELQNLAHQLGIAVQVLFVPATSDVAPWLHAIDIFVLPSISEAFSNSLMEAMASGCVPVASRVGGNPELVQHENTGLLFEKRNHEELAGCLERLIADPAERRRLGQAAAAFIHSRFSIAAAAECMGAIYSGLLQGR